MEQRTAATRVVDARRASPIARGGPPLFHSVLDSVFVHSQAGRNRKGRPAAGRVLAVTRRLAAPLLLALVTSLTDPAAAALPRPDPVEGVWPLDPVPDVVAGFDPPGEPWASGHRGVDLAGSAGQSVRAALAGTVQYAGRIAGRGVVVVTHGATRTTYEPVDAGVALGAAVTPGAVLGVLELAGGHCLPRACLHWGLREGEAYLDPLTLLGGGPIRLLPLWRETPTGVAGRGFAVAPTAVLAESLVILDPTGTLTPIVLAADQARGCACR
jgi:murein DD-endopeptidase MepM/ murein hydrolase activator NlpD